MLKSNQAGPWSGILFLRAVILMLGDCGITILELKGATVLVIKVDEPATGNSDANIS